MNYQTILATGVAWPYRKAPNRKNAGQMRRAIPYPGSVAEKVQNFVAENPGLRRGEIIKALAHVAKDTTVDNSVSRLYTARRLDADYIEVQGKRIRLYKLGPRG